MRKMGKTNFIGKSILDSSSIKAQATRYKGGKVEDIEVKIKCPFCDVLISLAFDLEECICIFNPTLQKYEVTHTVKCTNCGNEIKNVTITISRRGGWSVS